MSVTRLVVAAALACALLPASGELSGRRAPSFALPDASLKYHDLLDYRGKPLLIEITQTSCPHCQTFAPILEKVKAKYGDRLAILSVVLYTEDNQQTVARYIAAFKVTVPVLFDCGQMAAAYLKATPQKPQIVFPHIFLIDPEGTIRNDFGYSLLTRGIFEGDGLFAEIDKLLAVKR